MDGLRDFDTKQSKSDRERQISYDITYMQNLSTYIYIYIHTHTHTHTHKWPHLQNRNTLIDLQNKLMVLGVKGGEGWIGSWGWHAIFKISKI